MELFNAYTLTIRNPTVAGRDSNIKVEIKGEERKRNDDVYMPFARTFTHVIEIDVPAGYTAVGLDKFNFSEISRQRTKTNNKVS